MLPLGSTGSEQKSVPPSIISYNNLLIITRIPLLSLFEIISGLFPCVQLHILYNWVMSVMSAEYPVNGFSDHHDADIKQNGSNGIRRSSSTSSMDRLARELRAMMRPNSQTSGPKDEIDDDVIREVRRRVLETANLFKDQFDSCDIDWIRDTDDMIFRNILVFRDNHPKNKSIEFMYAVVHDSVIATLKWRHDFGINTVRDEDIPKEFYNAKAALFYIGTDGRLYLFIKVRKYRKFSSVWTDISIKFAIHEIDKALREFSYTYKRGIYDLNPVIILDGNDTGIAQVDLRNFFIGRGIFMNHYPKTFKEIWILGCPWWVKPFVSIAMKALPTYVTDFCKLVDSESMIRDAGAENVPTCLGGLRAEIYIEPPPVTATIEQVGRKIGASRAEIKRLADHLKSVAE